MDSKVIKKSNGNESQSLIFFIHTNKKASECEDSVMEWFLECLTPSAKQLETEHGQCD